MCSIRVVMRRGTEDAKNNLRIALRIAASNLFGRPAAQAEIFRRDDQASHRTVAQLGNVRLARYRNFVQAFGAMKNEGAPYAQFAERSCDQLGETRVIHSNDLHRRPGGIRQRAEQVEHCAHAEFASHRHGMSRGSMHRRGEHESNANFLD